MGDSYNSAMRICFVLFRFLGSFMIRGIRSFCIFLWKKAEVGRLPLVEPYRHEVLAGACGVEKLMTSTNESVLL